MFPANPVPSWVLPLPGVKFDFDFANGRYFGGDAPQVSSGAATKAALRTIQGSSMTTPSTFYAVDNLGNLLTILEYAPRVAPGTGLWAEGMYTNHLLYSRDQTNAAWVKTNMTAAKNQPSADANSAGGTTANAASSLTATAANATSLQSITLASSLGVGSVWAKRITGTGPVYMTIDGGTTWVDVTSQLNTSTYTWVKNVPSQTIANPSVGVKIATSGDAIAVDHFQHENNGYPTTPLPTTSATQTRSNDEPAVADPAGSSPGDGARLIRTVLCTGGPFWVYVAAAGNSTHSQILISDGDFTLGSPTNGLTCFMGSAAGGSPSTTANTSTFGLANLNKVMGRRNGQGNACCLNGGAVSTPVAASLIALGATFTHIGLGNNGGGGVPHDGYISRLAFGVGDVSDGRMIEVTR